MASHNLGRIYRHKISIQFSREKKGYLYLVMAFLEGTPICRLYSLVLRKMYEPPITIITPPPFSGHAILFTILSWGFLSVSQFNSMSCHLIWWMLLDISSSCWKHFCFWPMTSSLPPISTLISLTISTLASPSSDHDIILFKASQWFWNKYLRLKITVLILTHIALGFWLYIPCPA